MLQAGILLILLGFEILKSSPYLPREYKFEDEFYRTRYEDPGVCGPEGIAVAPNGNVYVASTYDDRIVYFTPAGMYLGEWGSPGTGPGQFRRPTGVAVSKRGIVYVADFWNCRIQYFTLEGNFLGSWGAEGSGPGEFNWLCSIAVGPAGDVFVSDRANRDIQRFTATGGWLAGWTVKPSDPEPMRDYLDVDVGPDGTVYVSGFNRPGCQRFSRYGDYLGELEYYGSGLSRRDAGGLITFAPNGVACAFGDGGFRTFDVYGSLIGVWRGGDEPILEQTGSFKAWAVGPGGTVYFAAPNETITYFTLTGRPFVPITRVQLLFAFAILELSALLFVLLCFTWFRKIMSV